MREFTNVLDVIVSDPGPELHWSRNSPHAAALEFASKLRLM
jgi:hypothetical protein